MKYLYKRDTFGATIAVLLITGVLLYNPFNEHIFNPLNIAFTDFSYSDLAFSEAHLKKTHDERIVVINTDTAQRKSIATLVNQLKEYQPKVVGLDILFPQKTSEGNEEMAEAVQSFPNLITVVKLEYDADKKELATSKNQFAVDESRCGFVNFIGEEGAVVRYFSPFISDKKKNYESFTALILKIYDSTGYQKLRSRQKNVEYINYQRTDSDYYIVNIADILSNKVDSSFIRDKIVLIGFVSQNRNNIDDKHFTPLNSKVLGRSLPDMNGVIIHANILSMLLDRNYITKVPIFIIILLTAIITWLHVAFLIKYYIHKHIWFHLVVKLVELISAIALFYISILMLRYLDINMDFTLTLLAIIITVDILYFYEAFANWLTRRFQIISIFNQTKHS